MTPDILAAEAAERMRAGLESYYLGRSAQSSQSAAEVVAFEAEVAGAFGSRYAIAVNSGTSAIEVALRAAGVGAGDEVLVPSLSVIMSASPVASVGATPIFFDSRSNGLGYDLDLISSLVTSRTRAVLAVHMWGILDNIEELAQFTSDIGVPLVEDACQAHGSRSPSGQLAGSFGVAGCFSMRDGKLMSTGEGGFLLTNSSSIATFAASYRNHWGSLDSAGGPFRRVANNFRMSALVALAGRYEIGRLVTRIDSRHELWTEVMRALSGDGFSSPSEQLSSLSNLYCPVLIAPTLATQSGPSFGARMHELGIPNSVGTFRLIPNSERGLFGAASESPAVRRLLDRAAPVILPIDATMDIAAEVIHCARLAARS